MDANHRLGHAGAMTRLTIRLDFDSGISIGPGKIGLLEAVEETGSIRRAADRMDMSFRQAWLLLQAIEDMFGAPVTETARGGSGGGGSRLTELGRRVVSHYREMESLAGGAAQDQMLALASLAKATRSPARAKPGISRKTLKKKQKI
jgi:molybdate transport system regulatory protein